MPSPRRGSLLGHRLDDVGGGAVLLFDGRGVVAQLPLGVKGDDEVAQRLSLGADKVRFLGEAGLPQKANLPQRRGRSVGGAGDHGGGCIAMGADHGGGSIEGGLTAIEAAQLAVGPAGRSGLRRGEEFPIDFSIQ